LLVVAVAAAPSPLTDVATRALEARASVGDVEGKWKRVDAVHTQRQERRKRNKARQQKRSHTRRWVGNPTRWNRNPNTSPKLELCHFSLLRVGCLLIRSSPSLSPSLVSVLLVCVGQLFNMATSLLEQTRSAHEDIERMERMIVASLIEDPTTVCLRAADPTH
jgi:hypothetical protein